MNSEYPPGSFGYEADRTESAMRGVLRELDSLPLIPRLLSWPIQRRLRRSLDALAATRVHVTDEQYEMIRRYLES